MGTVETGMAKWERRTANAGSKWKANTNAANLRAGLQAAGFSPGPEFMRAYEEGIGAVSAEDFNNSIRGKAAKWRENTVRGISR